MISLEEVPTQSSRSSVAQSSEFFLDKLVRDEPPIIVMPEAPLLPHRGLLKVSFLGLCFLVLFTAFDTVPIFVSDVYFSFGFYWLGKLTELIYFAVCWISVFFMAGLIQNWSYKKGLVVGALGYIFPLIAGAVTIPCIPDPKDEVPPAWCTDTLIYTINIICSGVNGLIAPALWLSANKYVSSCADYPNKGKYFGVFSGFVSASQVLRNTLASFVIKTNINFTLYLIPSVCLVIAVCLFFYAPNVEKNSEEEEPFETLKTTAKRILKLAFNRRMKPFLAYCLFVGLINAIYNGFERLIIDDALKNKVFDDGTPVTPIFFLIQGGVGVVTSFVAGRLGDRMKRRRALTLFNFISVLAIIMSFWSYIFNSIIFCGIMAVCLGIGVSGVWCLTNVVIAKDFGGTIEAFALGQALLNFATIFGLIFSLALPNYIIGFLCLALVTLIINQISTQFYRQRDEELIQ